MAESRDYSQKSLEELVWYYNALFNNDPELPALKTYLESQGVQFEKNGATPFGYATIVEKKLGTKIIAKKSSVLGK